MPSPFTDGVLASTEALQATQDMTNYLSLLCRLFEPVYDLVADQGTAGDSDYVPGWSSLLDPNNCPTQWLPYLAQFVGTVIPPGTPDITARQILLARSNFARGTLSAIMSAALTQLAGTGNQLGTLQPLAEGSSTLSTSGPITQIPVYPLAQLVAPQIITLTDPTQTYIQNFTVMQAAPAGATALQVYPQTPTYPFPVNSTVQGPFLFVRERFNGVTSTADPYHLTLGFLPQELVGSLSAMQTAVNAVKPAGIIIDYVESSGWTWNESSGTWNADTMTWQATTTQQP